MTFQVELDTGIQLRPRRATQYQIEEFGCRFISSARSLCHGAADDAARWSGS